MTSVTHDQIEEQNNRYGAKNQNAMAKTNKFEFVYFNSFIVSKTLQLDPNIQGHPERMLKVNKM